MQIYTIALTNGDDSAFGSGGWDQLAIWTPGI